MTASRVRARLRQGRQKHNLSTLTRDDKQPSINAVRNFIIFGGKRGHGTGGGFEVFAKRWPLGKDKVEAPKPIKRALHHFFARISYVRSVLKRRARNKRARKQRARA